MNFNGLTEAQEERFALLFEESSEVIKLVGKIFRHGLTSKHPVSGMDNRELIVRELIDVEIALSLILMSGDLPETKTLEVYREEKIRKLQKYLHLPENDVLLRMLLSYMRVNK